MRLSIYNRILKDKGEDPYDYASLSRKHKKKGALKFLTVGEKAFRNDISKGKTIWVNSKWQDYKLFVSSNHPLLGLCKVRAFHPYSQKKRMSVNYATICVGLFLAVLGAFIAGDLLDRFNITEGLDFTDDISNYYIFVFGGINSIILTTIFFFIRRFLSCICTCIYYNKRGVLILFVLTLIFITVSIVFTVLHKIIHEFLWIFLLEFIISGILQLICLYIQFTSRWRRDDKMMKKLIIFNSKHGKTDKNKKERKKICPYYITYMDYIEWQEKNIGIVQQYIKKNQPEMLALKKSSVSVQYGNPLLEVDDDDIEQKINSKSVLDDVLNDIPSDSDADNESPEFDVDWN